MFNPDLYLPGKGDAILSRKGKALARNDFEQMLREYYRLRGWDEATGFLTRGKLIALGLQELIEPLREQAV
jgi:aldehyde:ferredoxin oxidoreductase